MLEEANLQNQINNITNQQWSSLFHLIPQISEANNFGHWENYYFSESKLIQQFRKLAYDLPLVVKFDWTNWTEGKTALQNKIFDFNAQDLPFLCRIITLIIRQDRFSEGYLVTNFKNGTIEKILNAIKNNC